MEKLTVSEIAAKYNITTSGVRYWIKKGLPTETERVIGSKERIIINPEDFERFLKLTKQ